jgi:hypothetical protein
MADVTTYKRATMSYVQAGGVVVHVNDVRAAGDAVVTANPQWWVALTDTEMASGKNQNHQA